MDSVVGNSEERFLQTEDRGKLVRNNLEFLPAEILRLVPEVGRHLLDTSQGLDDERVHLLVDPGVLRSLLGRDGCLGVIGVGAGVSLERCSGHLFLGDGGGVLQLLHKVGDGQVVIPQSVEGDVRGQETAGVTRACQGCACPGRASPSS